MDRCGLEARLQPAVGEILEKRMTTGGMSGVKERAGIVANGTRWPKIYRKHR